jgi:hypothetical protein
MNAFTFSEARASARAVPADVEAVQTTGYSEIGKGAARYVYDATVGQAYFTANPRTSFLAADGRGFRLSLDQTITPFTFGALGKEGFNAAVGLFDDVPNDTAPLQAFFDYCSQRRVERANWGGVFGVTAQIVMGGAFGQVEDSFATVDCFEGSMVLAVKQNISGAVLVNRCRRQTTFGPLAIVGPPNGYPSFANRRFDIGLVFEDRAQLGSFSTIHVSYARAAGVLAQSRPQDNTFANDLGKCAFYACGSGSLHADSFLTSPFYDKNNTGNASHYNQRSEFGVSVVPPPIVEELGIPMFVRIAGEIHAVTEIQRGNPTYGNYIKVFPWVNFATTGANGTLEWIYGGGLVVEGGDTAQHAGKVASTNCSAGIVLASMYNGDFTGTLQSNLFGCVVGSGPFNVSLGGTLKGYFEGNATDLLWNAIRWSPNAYFTIETQHAFDMGKVKGFTLRKADGVGLHPLSLPRFLINDVGYWRRFENARTFDNAGVWNYASLTFDVPASHIVPLHGNDVTIDVSVPAGTVYTDIFGYRARNVQVTGTGTGNKPTGSITVNPGSGRKINGGASGAAAVFTSFTGPVTLQAALDPADVNNCLVSIMSGK